ncbi:hypothetical protein DFH29DRAFT_769047, partial [Suillus ampliporus]
ELNGDQIHHLTNILTLCVDVHGKFDTLSTHHYQATPNQYRVCGDTFSTRNYPPTLIFTTSDPANLPLPDSRYLAIHAACCKVARLSGAGE